MYTDLLIPLNSFEVKHVEHTVRAYHVQNYGGIKQSMPQGNRHGIKSDFRLNGLCIFEPFEGGMSVVIKRHDHQLQTFAVILLNK